MAKQPKGHVAIKRKTLPWLYCRKCGLVYLKNDATRRAIRGPCEGDKYPDDDENEG